MQNRQSKNSGQRLREQGLPGACRTDKQKLLFSISTSARDPPETQLTCRGPGVGALACNDCEPQESVFLAISCPIRIDQSFPNLCRLGTRIFETEPGVFVELLSRMLLQTLMRCRNVNTRAWMSLGPQRLLPQKEHMVSSKRAPYALDFRVTLSAKSLLGHFHTDHPEAISVQQLLPSAT